ncbi:MAG TPA: hypothetical protein VG389_10575 [Myxococcota bacterium]|jgi:hypothetical protein|nr:hypothetical protein [Myxococcota bacterium]
MWTRVRLLARACAPAAAPLLLLAAVGAAATAGSPAGCGFPQFDPPSLVDSVRILAIKAEPPEVAPGESSVVTASIFDPAGAPLMIWSVCTPDPVAGASACAESLSGSGGTVADPQFGPTATVDVPIDALQGADAGEQVLAVASLIVCSGGDPTMGGDPTRCFPADAGTGGGDAGTATSFDEIPDTVEIGIKRITVSDSVVPNQNPVITEVNLSFDGGATTTPFPDTLVDCGAVTANACIGAGQTATFTVVAASGSVEGYTELVNGVEEPRTETLITSFFGTTGRFGNIRAVGDGPDATGMSDVWQSAPATEADGPSAQPGDTVRFWFVLRDGRGGTDYAERTLGVVP